eukprot:9156696-Pyramimonas_sp.AAC.1
MVPVAGAPQYGHGRGVINLGDLSSVGGGRVDRPPRQGIDVAGYLQAAASLGLNPMQSIQLGIAAGVVDGSGAESNASWLSFGAGAAAPSTASASRDGQVPPGGLEHQAAPPASAPKPAALEGAPPTGPN